MMDDRGRLPHEPGYQPLDPPAEAPDDGDDEIDPNDPDYDLSEAHGYLWEPQRAHWPVPPTALIVISILVAIALVLPSLIVIMQSR